MAALAVCSLTMNAQDVLVRKGGDVENVKVLEVTPTEVKYKKINNLEGPTFTEKRSNLISVKYASGETQKFNDAPAFGEGGAEGDYAYYEGYGKEKVMTNELSFQFGDGWGIGYQLRREMNPYFAINIVGIHYQTSWENPDKGGNINFRFLGARGYSPSWKWIRGYVDLNLGYTLCWADSGVKLSSEEKKLVEKYTGEKVDDDISTSHHFGLDFGVGIQLHKKVAIGYSLTYLTDGGTAHYAKLSFPF